MASTHSFPHSDHAAVISMASHSTREDGGVTEVTTTKIAVRDGGSTWIVRLFWFSFMVEMIENKCCHSKKVKSSAAAKYIKIFKSLQCDVESCFNN